MAFGTLVHLLLEAWHSNGPEARAAAESEARHVARFFVGVGLPVTLHELGIDAADTAALDAVAARATAPGETIHALPFPVDAAAVVAAIAAADHVGRAARGDPVT